MAHIQNVTDLINKLNWAKTLLAEMFGKRKQFAYTYDHALALLSEDKLEALIHNGILRRNGPHLEIDDQYQQFFEQVLEVNEDINPSYINENLQQLKQFILYYLQENQEHRRYNWLRQVRNALRKIGRTTLRNIIDLNRNIENTFKTEPSYQIKVARLEALDDKRRTIQQLIEKTESLLSTDEATFFATAPDGELRAVVNQLRGQLTESRHNLIETQKQIIEYLNQVKYQSRILEKIKQVKYLKDQFELKSKTNLVQLLENTHPVLFESRPAYSLKLPLEYLQTDDARPLIEKMAARQKTGKKPALAIATELSSEELLPETESEIFINLDEIRNSFMASGHHLYQFMQQYRFPRPVSEEEFATLFCQMVGVYEQELDINDQFMTDGNLEYAVVRTGKRTVKN